MQLAQAQHKVEEAEGKLREAKAGRRESDRDRRGRETMAALKRSFTGVGPYTVVIWCAEHSGLSLRSGSPRTQLPRYRLMLYVSVVSND